MSAIPFIHVQARGSHREIGRAVGEAAQPQIQTAMAYYRERSCAILGLSFATARERAAAYLPWAERHFPQYVEELRGMGEAAHLALEDILVPNCIEELAFAGPSGDAPRPGLAAGRSCTAVAVSTGGRHIVGHNMDWYAIDLDTSVLLDVTCPGGTRFLMLSGMPYLAISGMTSCGLAFVGNSLFSTDDRLGVPRAFISRWALEADGLEEAMARVCHPLRSTGCNNLWGDVSGRLVDVETSATQAAVVEAQEWYAHTNHYTCESMSHVEASLGTESRRRLARAEMLLAEGVARGDDPLELVARVLSDHANAPDSICSHVSDDDHPGMSTVTVGSMICDLDNGRLHACVGAPCSNPYRTFGL